jgi:hypothetical protein
MEAGRWKLEEERQTKPEAWRARGGSGERVAFAWWTRCNSCCSTQSLGLFRRTIRRPRPPVGVSNSVLSLRGEQIKPLVGEALLNGGNKVARDVTGRSEHLKNTLRMASKRDLGELSREAPVSGGDGTLRLLSDLQPVAHAGGERGAPVAVGPLLAKSAVTSEV